MAKEKMDEMTNMDLQNNTQKIKDRVNTEDELRCYGMVGSG
jgi:hypothetical protein